MLPEQADTKRAVGRAVEFLLQARIDGCGASGSEPLQTGRFWRDFRVAGVQSDEWVTAYAACALAETGNRQGYEAAECAWNWLIRRSQQDRPGLGYNRRTPRDADSTLWGCRLAAAIGRSPDEWTGCAVRYLRTCSRADGGIATFAKAADLSTLKLDSAPEAVEGWTISHECVTAAAAWLPQVVNFADVCGFLARTQQPEGFWRAYWWADADYATAHAIESLVRMSADQAVIDRGLAWLCRSPSNRSPFVLALRVLGISKARSQSFRLALRQLLDLQLANGSWAASARLRLPPPKLKNPAIIWNWDEHHDGLGGIILDRQGVFTTATVLRALSSCLTQ
jgi:hypothetical protein